MPPGRRCSRLGQRVQAGIVDAGRAETQVDLSCTLGVHVGSEGDEGFASMSEMAAGTGSVDALGEGLAEATDASTVSTALADLFQFLVTKTPMDVQVIPMDEPDDPPGADYDATIFLKDATPLSGRPPEPEGFASMDETFFHDTVPGTTLTFDLDFYNNTVPPIDHIQFFKLWILVLGNRSEVLGRVMVAIIVPSPEDDWFPGP